MVMKQAQEIHELKTAQKGQTSPKGPNQPKSQILFDTKSPPHEFTRMTLFVHDKLSSKSARTSDSCIKSEKIL